MSPKLLDLFASAGGAGEGYRRAGFDVTGVDLVRRACGYPCGGLVVADALEVLADVDFVRSFDAVHASPPCFPAGTPVVTARGVVAIEDVVVGDRVLTHRNRWRDVIDTMDRDADVVADGWLASTPDHPFWSREQLAPATRGAGFTLAAAEWTPAEDLRGRFVAVPTKAEPLEVPSIDGRPIDSGSEAFWRMVGRWLGDGWLRIVDADPEPPSPRRPFSSEPRACLRCGKPAARHGRHQHLWTSFCSRTCAAAVNRSSRTTPRSEVIVCCSFDEGDELDASLRSIGLTWTRSRERTTWRFTAAHTGLPRWLEANFGRYAHGKTIPGWLLGADRYVRAAVLEGYLEADGHATPSGFRATTVSRNLAVGVRLLATSLGHTTGLFGGTVPGRSGRAEIEGRAVNERPTWVVAINPDDGRYTRIEDGHRWVKRRKAMTPSGRERVYDLTVEEDHSFVAHGFVVHNCQDNSRTKHLRDAQGKSAGARSGNLIPQVREALEAAGVPYVIENVEGSDLRPDLVLCGSMFPELAVCDETGRRWLKRHRVFESNVPLMAPGPCNHRAGVRPLGVYGSMRDDIPSGGQTCRSLEQARELMGIEWMSWKALTEAIPPAYTEAIGAQLMTALELAAVGP